MGVDYSGTFSDFGGLGVFAVFAGLMLFIGIIMLIASLLIIISRWKIFQKAGLAGWEAIIPFYSSWKLVEISQLEWWFFFIVNATFIGGVASGGILASFSGLISLGGYFFVNYNLSKKFKKDPVGFAIGLTLLPIVFYPILAFGKNNDYNENISVSSYGPISEDKINNNNNKENKKNTNSKFCTKCGNDVKNSKFCSKCGNEIR